MIPPVIPSESEGSRRGQDSSRTASIANITGFPGLTASE